MRLDLTKKTQVLVWQALFLALSTSWLCAPQLNPSLSYRSSLISQYETAHQPYSWLFRLCDLAAGLLLLAAANYYLRNVKPKAVGIILAILSVGLILDPLLSTSCRNIGDICKEYFSFNFVLHAFETILTAAIFFVGGIYDAYHRRKVVSIAFVIFQLAYGGLFLTQLADQEHFNTLSQFIYQVVLVIWVGWWVRDYIEPVGKLPDWKLPGIKNLVAGWAFLNGITAILISLWHINLLGKIQGVYFTSNNAWLTQHGMIIGVVMLYLSRHLARGERRARQIFLFVIGIEAIKYAVLVPSGPLLALYITTFIGLFLARDSFDRGTVTLTWQLRLKDLAFLLAGLLTAAAIALLALDRDSRASVIVSRAVDNFGDYIANNPQVTKYHITAVLLAHSISVFIGASAISILWVLFRPNKTTLKRRRNYGLVRQMLKQYSKSSEDYFKFWPKDKDFYWGTTARGFVAYKLVGSTAFVLADPISSKPATLINEFNEWCRAHRLKVCYLPVYESNLNLYKESQLEVMQIGSSAEINIQNFLNETIKDKWWRWKLNQAKKMHYTYAKSIPPHSPKLFQQLRAVSDAWLEVGNHNERGFALGYYSQQYIGECIIHYLTQPNGEVVAFANELPQFNPTNKTTVDLMRYAPGASNSIPYLLFKVIEDSSRTELDKETFDLGFVPFAQASGPLLAIAKTLNGGRFSVSGLEQFKNKFKPAWSPNYMAYDGDLADLAVIALNIEKLMDPNNLLEN